MKKENAKLIAAILFIMSGASGLVYQIAWFKYLHLFLGNTTYAQMIVLIAFLGGLAIGNNYFGNRADKSINSLRFYGSLEIFIAIYCFAYPTLTSLLGNLFLSLASAWQIESNLFLLNSIRFIISTILLVAPTIAMGGTLPILSKFYVENINDSRKDVATLYFLNSFGAVVGIFFAGFVLIKEFGLNVTIYTAAAINLIIGAVALIVSKKDFSTTSEEETSTGERPEETETITPNIGKLVISVAFLSGFAALMYEMVWTRLLINFLGSSTYAFSLMLLAFISGITIGGWIISLAVFNKYNKLNLLIIFQAVIASSTMFALLIYNRLPYYLWQISTIFSKTNEAFSFFLISEFLLCFSLMIIPTIFMGMTLPVCTELISKSTFKIGYSVGKVFSLNTLGNVLGVFFTSVIFIPLFGIKASFEIGIAINIIASVIIFIIHPHQKNSSRIIYGSVTAVIFLFYLAMFSSWDKSIILSGVFRKLNQTPPENFSEFQKAYSNENILYYKEGISATVAVAQSKNNFGEKRLIINGKPDASSYYDMPTQVLLAQIPLMLHPNPKNVFVVGFGSGTTIGSTLTHNIKKVTCAEISKEVIEASIYFRQENNDCLKDPRLKLINEDALTLLKASKEKYDVIISEPSNPWIAGIGNLFSEEYFSACRSKLNENGIMVQWFHLYEMNDEIVKLVLNTFHSVFPNAQVWNSVANDIILVGTKNKYASDFESLTSKFNLPEIQNDLKRININNLFTFLTCQLISRRGFFLMTNKEPINKEVHPRLEFLAPRAFYLSQPSTFIYSFDERYDSVSRGLLVKDFIKTHHVTNSDLYNTIVYHSNTTKAYRLAYGLARLLNDIEPGNFEVRRLYMNAHDNFELSGSRTLLLDQLMKDFPNSSEAVRDYSNASLLEKINASTFLHNYSLTEEAENFIKIETNDSISQTRVNIQLAKAFYLNGEYENSYKYISLAEKLILGNAALKEKINLDDYLFINAMISLYRRDFERVFVNYLALMNNNPSYENLNRLRKMSEWIVQKREKE